jgi:co-chaperonin GroES (HSP10)
MIRLIGDRVLVALPPKEHQQDETTGYTYQESKTKSGVILVAKPADTFNLEIATRGIVVQLGHKSNTCDLDEVRSEIHTWFVECPEDIVTIRQCGDTVDTLLMKMQPAPFAVDVGQMVIFPPTAGESFSEDGIDYVILREDDVLAVVEPLQKEEVTA